MRRASEVPDGRSDVAAHGPRGSTKADRDRQIVDRSIAGKPIIEIGRDYGFVSPGPAIRLVERSLDLVLPQLDPDLQRRLDLARLDRLLAAWWPRAISDDEQAAHLVLGLLEVKSRIRGDDGPGRTATDGLDGATP